MEAVNVIQSLLFLKNIWKSRSYGIKFFLKFIFHKPCENHTIMSIPLSSFRSLEGVSLQISQYSELFPWTN